MKKTVLMLAFFITASTAFVSCRDQKNAAEETNMEMDDGTLEVEDENDMNDDANLHDDDFHDDSLGDDLEEAANDVGDAVEEAAEETGDAVETAAEETANAAEEGWDEVKENTGTGGTDDM